MSSLRVIWPEPDDDEVDSASIRLAGLAASHRNRGSWPAKPASELAPAFSLEERARVVGGHVGVLGAEEQQRGTAHARHVLHGLVVEAVEAELQAAPEDEQVGGGEGGQAALLEAACSRGEQAVEGALEDDRIGGDAARVDGAQDGDGPEGDAVEQEPPRAVAVAREAHRGLDVERLVPADARHAPVRAARAAEVDQQHVEPEAVVGAGLPEQALLGRGVAVEEHDQVPRALRRYVPALDLEPVGRREGHGLELEPDRGRVAVVGRAADGHPGGQAPQLRDRRQVRGGADGPALDEVRRAPGVPEGHHVEGAHGQQREQGDPARAPTGPALPGRRSAGGRSPARSIRGSALSIRHGLACAGFNPGAASG